MGYDSAPSLSVTLHSGGTITLKCDTNIMQMDQTDRDLVFGLIDTILRYQVRQASLANEHQDQQAEDLT